MADAASSSSAPNIPVRWRRKAYMNANHTIAGYNSVDGSSASGPSDIATAGHCSTGPCARKDQQNKVHAGAQTGNAEDAAHGNSDAPRGQEPAPMLSPTQSHPAVIPASAFNYDQLAGKLEFMQRRMREGWNINGKQAEEKENAVAPPPPRPLKRKRAAPRTTPVAPVRQSVRLKRRAQGGDKE